MMRPRARPFAPPDASWSHWVSSRPCGRGPWSRERARRRPEEPAADGRRRRGRNPRRRFARRAYDRDDDRAEGDGHRAISSPSRIMPWRSPGACVFPATSASTRASTSSTASTRRRSRGLRHGAGSLTAAPRRHSRQTARSGAFGRLPQTAAGQRQRSGDDAAHRCAVHRPAVLRGAADRADADRRGLAAQPASALGD